jgi:predicted enzyme related to lactoylglutathione lyase
MTSAVNWFEIPVKNFERAKQFYSTILGIEIIDMALPDNTPYGVFPYDRDNNGVGGAIMEVKDENLPTQNGITVYLNGGNDLSIPLGKVEENGGKVIQTKTSIGENGFMAQFIDTEGNRLALHSMN